MQLDIERRAVSGEQDAAAGRPPPGCVGCEEGGQRAEPVRRRPHSVVLLDEMEKARPEVLARAETDSWEDVERMVGARLRERFRPEFLDRVDQVVAFRPLGQAQLEELVDLELARGVDLSAQQGVARAASDGARARIAAERFDRVCGSGPLKRAVRRRVQDLLALEMLDAGASVEQAETERGSGLEFKGRRGRPRRVSRPGAWPWSRVGLAAVAGAMAACSPTPPSPLGATPARPAGVVERFLDAAGRRDHAAMAALFGTASGPLGSRGGPGCALRRLGSWMRVARACSSFADVERRMIVVAEFLDGAVAREVREASPSAPAGADGSIRLLVGVDLGGGGAAWVPFVLVRTATGAWLVREIGLASLVGDVGPGSGAPQWASVEAPQASRPPIRAGPPASPRIRPARRLRNGDAGTRRGGRAPRRPARPT